MPVVRYNLKVDFTGSRPQLTPEILVSRLGDYLVEKQLISQKDLEFALETQKTIEKNNQPSRLLGQILVDMKVIDRPALDQVVTEQIINLREALERNNHELENRVKERTAELENALTKLFELNHLKANFVSNISHELRTPLTHIKGYLDLFESGALGSLSKDQDQAVEVMVKSTGRLETLIEDLILFSIMENDQLSLRIRPIKIQNLFKRIDIINSAKATFRQVDLKVIDPGNLPEVYADEEKIYWVITQLVDNAIKFSSPGGSVIVSAAQKNDAIWVNVSDNGIGIPQDKLNDIFEPFHQLDGSSTRRYGGTGIGLAIVKKLIDAHHSRIVLTSKPGQGSQFEFILSKTGGISNA
jgi:signal transduction histidine kinase